MVDGHAGNGEMEAAREVFMEISLFGHQWFLGTACRMVMSGYA